MPSITINHHYCKQCGICIAFCPRKVFSSDRAGGPIVEKGELCSACMLCVMRCPDLALEVEGA